MSETPFVAHLTPRENALLAIEMDAMNPNHPLPAEEPPVKKKPVISSVGDFLANVPPYEEDKDYLGPFLHGGYRVHVAGPIGHGKTSFMLEAVSAAVRGDSFLGWQGVGDVRCLYIDLEMPPELLGDAVRDARLGEGHNFHLLHLPDGLRIDTHPEDKRMLEEAVEGYHILVIDPWYKLMEQEMEYSGARHILATLDGIRARNPGLCTIVGYHSQEPYSRKDKLTLGMTSGFKFFHRAADVMLTFQRLEDDVSRLIWVKNRSAKLPVKHGEEWLVEWERGQGFSRVGEATLQDNPFV